MQTPATRFDTLDALEAAQADGIVPGYALETGAHRRLWVMLPSGVGSRLNIHPEDGWTVTEHDDGTITVEPSIHDVGGWHGFLRRDTFESC